MVAVCAGVGWLYLLRDVGVLAIGPKVSGALPLEELARQGAQPLGRMVVTWLPAGFAIGLVLTLATRLRPQWVALASGLLALVILGATTAASEALTINERLSQHVWPALSHSGLWVAVVLTVLGSLLAAVVARPAGSSAAGARGSWAA